MNRVWTEGHRGSLWQYTQLLLVMCLGVSCAVDTRQVGVVQAAGNAGNTSSPPVEAGGDSESNASQPSVEDTDDGAEEGAEPLAMLAEDVVSELPLQPVEESNEGGMAVDAATLPPVSSAPASLCGVESLELVANVFCQNLARSCEARVNCCQGDGFAATVDECVASERQSCRAGVLANLEAGACFLPEEFDPRCNEFFAEYELTCTIASVSSSAVGRQFAALRCGAAWQHGSLLAGELCTTSEQCDEPRDDTVSSCFPDFARDSEVSICQIFNRRLEGESCAGERDQCVEGRRCNSSGRCALPGAIGELCEDNRSDCESNLCLVGVCAEPVGRLCEVSDDCGARATCDAGLCLELDYPSIEQCELFSTATVSM